MIARPTVRLAPTIRRALHISGIGVWLTGILWLVFHSFLTQHGEFGPAPHPLEPWWLRLHAAFGFVLIWLFGYLWAAHISVAWPRPRRRLSGAILTALFLVLTTTGYLLYYLGDETLRSAASLTHWVLGLGAPLAFAAHRWKRSPPPARSAS